MSICSTLNKLMAHYDSTVETPTSMILNAGIQMQVKFTSADTVRRLLVVKGGFCFVCGIYISIYGELM